MNVPPFSTHPHWITDGERFFAKYGAIGILIGRFFGPLRAVMPFVAGFLEMPTLKFLIIDLISALAWSPFYLLPGYFVGAKMPSLLPEDERISMMIQVGFIVLSIVIAWLVVRFVRERIHSHSMK